MAERPFSAKAWVGLSTAYGHMTPCGQFLDENIFF